VKSQYSLLNTKSDIGQEITLRIYGEIVVVHPARTLKYGGYLDHETGQALAVLSRNYSITFRASLDEKTSTMERSTSNDCPSLLITLYGLRQDSDAVGTLLSENKLYLQQPSTLDPSAVYFNPQCLLRPGSEFNLADQQDSKSSTRENQMCQAIKHQTLRVFDSAVGPATFSEIRGSERLLTGLKLYANLETPFFNIPINSIAKVLQVSEESPGYDG
jgi:hypothetical protein